MQAMELSNESGVLPLFSDTVERERITSPEYIQPSLEADLPIWLRYTRQCYLFVPQLISPDQGSIGFSPLAVHTSFRWKGEGEGREHLFYSKRLNSISDIPPRDV